MKNLLRLPSFLTVLFLLPAAGLAQRALNDPAAALSQPDKPAPVVTPVVTKTDDSTTTQGQPKPSPADDEVVQLSKFEVNTSRNVGYMATESLAGTRIRTELADVGSAISVATKEFMNDIGATDSETLLQYMTGMEVGGALGNFLINNSDLDTTISDFSARTNPQGNTRSRGLDSADNSRDYFITDIPWDGYNTSRIDIQRGPNSILFGNGSPAGIINAAPDPAVISKKNSMSVKQKTGSYGSNYFSANLNYTLIPQQLAVRAAVLSNERNYQQEPAYQRDKRYYLAARYDPSFLNKNGNRASIKVNYEAGRIDANRPRLTTLPDAMFPWFLTAPVQLRSPVPLGRPEGTDQYYMGTLTPLKYHGGYDPFVNDISGNDLATLSAAYPDRLDLGSHISVTTITPNAEPWLSGVVYDNSQVMGATVPGAGTGGNGWFAVYPDPNSSAMSTYFYPVVNDLNYYALIPDNPSNSYYSSTIRNSNMSTLLTLDKYAFISLSDLLYGRQSIWRQPTITDPSTFDFYNKLIDGNNKVEASKFHTFNATFEQSFLHDIVGFQLSYDHQDYGNYARANIGTPIVRIDIYKYLPIAFTNPATGFMEPMLNPNFGRPYIISNPSASRNETTRDVARLTPYADLDFKKIFATNNLATKILGRHTITGLYEMSRVGATRSSWIPYALDPAQAAAIAGPNRGINDKTSAISTVSYLGPSLATAASAAGANLSALTAIQNPGSGPAWYFDSHWNSSVLPTAVYTSTLGIFPNQRNVSATSTQNTQLYNPVNYAGWGTSPRYLIVNNDAYTDERSLTTSYYQDKNQFISKALVDQWRILDGAIIVTAGLRQDRVDTYLPGDPSVAPSDPARNGFRLPVGGLSNRTYSVVDWNAPFSFASTPSFTYTSKWLKTFGAVTHVPDKWTSYLPGKLLLSGYFNYSENFQPVNRNDPVTGASLAPPVGTTREYGFTLSTPDKKFSLRLNWFDTKVKNASLNDNGIVGNMVDDVVNSLRSAKFTLFVYDINNGTNLSGGNPDHAIGIGNLPARGQGNLTPITPARSQGGSGTILDSTQYWPCQPARAYTADQPWTLQEWIDARDHAMAAANAVMQSFNDPIAVKLMYYYQINPDAFDYSAPNFGIIKTNQTGATVTGDTRSRGFEAEFFFTPTRNWTMTFNVAHTSAVRDNMAGDVGAWIEKRWALYNVPYDGPEAGFLAGGLRGNSTNQTAANGLYSQFSRDTYTKYTQYYAKMGTQPPEIRPWRFNIVTSYKFASGFLKGASIGASWRWEDHSIIGYYVTEAQPDTYVPNGSGGQLLIPAIGYPNASKPIYGQVESHISAWASYNIRLFNRINWKIQLNVSNVGEKAHLVPVTTNGDGSTAAYRIASGMVWELSNTWDF